MVPGAARIRKVILSAIVCSFCSYGFSENVPARHQEGFIHGFLELKDSKSKRIATGDLVQTVHGVTVTSRLVFRFLDGSIDDERTVFTQRGTLQLVRDHHVQKGPSFPTSLDLDIDVPDQKVTSRTEKDGKTEEASTHLDMPADIANGLPLVLAKNIPLSTPQTKVAYLAMAPKPTIVHLAITPDGERKFSIGRSHYKAACLLYHVELGGLKGVIAPLIGKEPADSRVWVIEGEAPSFVRAEAMFYYGGPMWTIELSSPVWPADASLTRSK